MASLATHGKARTKAALQRFSHEGGHAFAEPPSKVVGENKKFRRESMKALAEGANHISTGASIVMKKARKSIVNIKNTIMKKKETLPVRSITS